MKKLLVVVHIILCSIIMTACGASSDYGSIDYDYSDSGDFTTNSVGGFTDDIYYEEADSIYNESYQSEQPKQVSSEKLVYTGSVTIETTSYKEDMAAIKSFIRQYSGIIQNESESSSGSWYYDGYGESRCMTNNLTIRVLSSDYDSFINSIGDVGNIVAKSQTVSNITQSYYDTSTTLESYKIQEKRLLEMYDSAYTIEDMIMVENRLTEVQNQIRMYQSRVSQMDTDVMYATVNIRVTEVKEYTPVEEEEDTFFTRLWDTVVDTWEGFLAFLEWLLFTVIRLLPYIPLIAIVYWLWRGVRKHSEKKIKLGNPKE